MYTATWTMNYCQLPEQTLRFSSSILVRCVTLVIDTCTGDGEAAIWQTPSQNLSLADRIRSSTSLCFLQHFYAVLKLTKLSKIKYWPNHIAIGHTEPTNQQ